MIRWLSGVIGSRIFVRGAGALLGLAALSSPAWADSIDGNWCNEKTGKTMQIEGPSIVTPGGSRIEGRYSRHSFAYTVPERETPAGVLVTMGLVNENAVRVQAGEGQAAEIWRRCEQTS
jgi:hypothetical protein